MDNVILYRIDQARNMCRYYRLDVQPDLFGVWLLVREWGRIGRAGQTRLVSFATRNEARHALQRLLSAKEKRQYAAPETVHSVVDSAAKECGNVT